MLVEAGYGFEHRQACPGRTFRIVVVCRRPPEISHHAIAEIFGDVAAESGNHFGGGTMISGDRLAPFFGVEPRGNLGGANQITKQHRQMPPLTGGRHQGRRDAFSFGPDTAD